MSQITKRVCDFNGCGKEVPIGHDIRLTVSSGMDASGNGRSYDVRNVDLCHVHAIAVIKILKRNGTEESQAKLFKEITGVNP